MQGTVVSPKQKRIFRNTAVVLFVMLVVLVVSRNFLLRVLLKNAFEKIHSRYGLQASVGEAHLSGISTLHLSHLLLLRGTQDTLLYCRNLQAGLRPFYLLTGRVRLQELHTEKLSLLLNRSKGHDNFSFLLKQRKSGAEGTAPAEPEWGQTANRILNKIFSSVPEETSCIDTRFCYRNDTAETRWKIPFITSTDNRLRLAASVYEKGQVSTWVAGAMINSRDRAASVKVYPVGTGKNNLPFLKIFYNLEMGFDTLTLSLYSTDYSNQTLTLSGKAGIRNLRMHHWRISPDDVGVQLAKADFLCELGSSSCNVLPGTQVAFNRLLFAPQCSYRVRPARTFSAVVDMENVSADHFFASMPQGLFGNFAGIRAEGTLQYHADLAIDESQLDSLSFHSALTGKGFRVKEYGQTNFTRINDEFMYTAFEKGVPVATFPVGLSNPDFYPLDQISPFLKHAVMCSEDGDFYYHNGFNEKAFRKSIATNLREKKFKRGGSTITMQLVKNVFLTRNKTISRKLEEALIVWLIENHHLCSKDRMLEVYLNIIEWGPGVYGIGQASRYYFNKKPADLSLAEAIYLAMIIPRPKWFQYNFDDTGNLKPYIADYYRLLSGHLLRREVISEEEKNQLLPEVHITGKALEKIRVASPDSLPALIDGDEGMGEEN